MSGSFVTAIEFPPSDAAAHRLELPITGNARIHNQPNGTQKPEKVAFDIPINERTELLGTPTIRTTVVPNGRDSASDVHVLVCQGRRGGDDHGPDHTRRCRGTDETRPRRRLISV